MVTKELGTVQQQTIKDWGNGLGVRINAGIAKAAHLHRGAQVALEVVAGGIMLRVLPQPKLTLEQKLAAFDPAKHGGEFIATGSVGAERF